MRTVDLITAAGTVVATIATLVSLRYRKRGGLTPIQRWRERHATRAPSATPSSPE